MTTRELLEKLRKERDQLDNAIHYIERAISHKSKVQKAHDIVASVSNDKEEKKFYTKKKKIHWTQTPAGRRKMSKLMRQLHAEKSAQGLSWKGNK